MALLAIAPSADNLDRKFKSYSEKFRILAPHLKRAIALSKTGRSAAPRIMIGFYLPQARLHYNRDFACSCRPTQSLNITQLSGQSEAQCRAMSSSMACPCKSARASC